MRLGDFGSPVSNSIAGQLAIELGFFTGLGALIIFFGAMALGRVSVRSLRDGRAGDAGERRGLLGLQPGKYVGKDRAGRFAEMRFDAPDIAGLALSAGYVHLTDWFTVAAAAVASGASVSLWLTGEAAWFAPRFPIG